MGFEQRLGAAPATLLCVFGCRRSFLVGSGLFHWQLSCGSLWFRCARERWAQGFSFPPSWPVSPTGLCGSLRAVFLEPQFLFSSSVLKVATLPVSARPTLDWSPQSGFRAARTAASPMLTCPPTRSGAQAHPLLLAAAPCCQPRLSAPPRRAYASEIFLLREHARNPENV